MRSLNIIISYEEYFNCQWFSKRVYHQQGILLIKNHLGLIEKNQLINDEIPLLSRSILWYSKIAKVKIQWQYFFFIRKRNADILRSVFQAKFHHVMFFCFQPILWNRCANCRPCGWSNICFSSGYVLEDMSITCLYKWSSIESCIQYNDVKVNRCWEYKEFIFLMFFGGNKTLYLVFL